MATLGTEPLVPLLSIAYTTPPTVEPCEKHISALQATLQKLGFN